MLKINKLHKINTKKVNFSNNVQFFFIDYNNLQCTRQYYDDYVICKKQFLENQFIIMNGSLKNFSYDYEIEKHLREEIEYEKYITNELQLEKYLVNNNNLITKYNDLYDELDNTINKLKYSEYVLSSDSDSDTDTCEYLYKEDSLNINDNLDFGFDFTIGK
jgi:hypothetical protein